jgi:hypothetical protein
MMAGTADNAVQKSAQTSKDSQDAVFAIVQGKKPPKTPEQIKAQFPSKVKDDTLGEVPLPQWQDQLVKNVPAMTDAAIKDNPALGDILLTTGIVDRFLGGVSGAGKAVGVDKPGGAKAPDVPHDPF